MTIRRGSILIVDFGGPAKLRPALVVQNDRDNARLANTIVVQITSNISRSHESTQHLIDPSHVDWGPSGLLRPSVVNGLNIAYVGQRHITRPVGSLSATTMQHVNQCLIVALALA